MQPDQSYNSYSTKRRFNFAGLDRRLQILIILVIVLLTIGLLSLIFQPPSDKDLANSFVKAVVSNQPDKAYELTSSQFQSKTSKSVWESRVKAGSSLLNGKPKFNNEIVNVLADKTEQHKYIYDLKTNANTYNLEVWMSKDAKSKWKVDYFSATLNTQ